MNNVRIIVIQANWMLHWASLIISVTNIVIDNCRDYFSTNLWLLHIIWVKQSSHTPPLHLYVYEETAQAFSLTTLWMVFSMLSALKWYIGTLVISPLIWFHRTYYKYCELNFFFFLFFLCLPECLTGSVWLNHEMDRFFSLLQTTTSCCKWSKIWLGSGFVGCPPGHRSWSLVILSVHKWHLIIYWVWNKTFCWWLCLLSWN